MTDLEKRLQRLRALNASVEIQDKALAAERTDLRPKISAKLAVERELDEGKAIPKDRDLVVEITKESIILRRERPILAIRDNKTELVFKDQADSAIWKQRLTDAEPALDVAIRAAGRIELSGSEFDWIGTGWLVHDHVVVTNRHVAEEFARHDGDSFVFRQGASGPMTARIDFLEEIDNPNELGPTLINGVHTRAWL